MFSPAIASLPELVYTGFYTPTCSCLLYNGSVTVVMRFSSFISATLLPFYSMTGVGGRPELIVEGSDDMQDGPWKVRTTVNLYVHWYVYVSLQNLVAWYLSVSPIAFVCEAAAVIHLCKIENTI